jgi:succinate-semialdehyde dehydrogenase/glutarate-semialdehyde dehydrogenase
MMDGYPVPQLLIDGEWLTRSSSSSVIDPATGKTIAHLPHATDEDLDNAVAAASRAFAGWRRTAPAVRSEIMMRAAALVRGRIDAIAASVTADNGKTLATARGEVIRACEIIEWDASEGRRLYGRVIPGAHGMRTTVVREPSGVVAAITPWNFPVASPARKIAGALAAGCSIVLKPAEEAPSGALALARAFQEAGVPDGVINVIFGDPSTISQRLIRDPAIRLITFTGSVAVGKRLASLAGGQMKPVIMELGGHAPVFVCADADPQAAAEQSIAAKAMNTGQVCVSPTRFYVARAIYDRFAQACVQAAQQISIGQGTRDDVVMGPLASSRRREAVESLVADAIQVGGRLLTGGLRTEGAGYFYPLTVLADVPAMARVLHEEPFGPIAILIPFDSLSDAIAQANAVNYGLAAYAFTSCADTIAMLSDNVACGNLAINHFGASSAETPMGGVKDSGLGREGGSEGLEGYTVAKTVIYRAVG